MRLSANGIASYTFIQIPPTGGFTAAFDFAGSSRHRRSNQGWEKE
jgi:hypothetical protein